LAVDDSDANISLLKVDAKGSIDLADFEIGDLSGGASDHPRQTQAHTPTVALLALRED